MTAVRIGVIGVGRIGRLHAELLAHRVPGTVLAGVCDADRALAAKVGRALAVTTHAPPEAMLADADVDAVAICSPTPTHADLIVAAAQAGKAIFCEKPLALSLDELDRALDAVARAGVALQVGFNRRYDPGHRSVAEAVAGGRIGEPHVVRITSRDPAPPAAAYARTSGGLFLDMTVHDFDMARYLAGSDVVEVYAAGSARLPDTGAHDGDVDTAVVTLVHANGCLTSIDNSRRATYGFDQRIEVHGSTGMASSENAPRHGGVVRDADGTSSPPLPAFFRERYEQSYSRSGRRSPRRCGSATRRPWGPPDARCCARHRAVRLAIASRARRYERPSSSMGARAQSAPRAPLSASRSISATRTGPSAATVAVLATSCSSPTSPNVAPAPSTRSRSPATTRTRPGTRPGGREPPAGRTASGPTSSTT